MFTHICPYCHNSYTSFSSKSKFCSKVCHNNSRRGIKRPKHAKIVSAKLKEYYKTEHFKENKKLRYDKIAAKKSAKLSDSQLSLLRNILSEMYVRDLLILSEKVFGSRSSRVLRNTFRKFPDLKELYNKTIKALPQYLQVLSIEEWQEVKQLIKSGDYLSLKRKYNVSTKTRQRIENHFNIKFCNGKINSKETTIERKIREILEKNNINYKREVGVNNFKYYIDFIINETFCIEVQGDYWHANPLIFDECSLNKTQLRNKINDINKREWLLKNNFSLLEIWERDLFLNEQRIINLIKDYDQKNIPERFFSTSIWNIGVERGRNNRCDC